MQLEDSFLNYAKSTGKDSVILCDRGVMDGSAYVSRQEWNRLLKVSRLRYMSVSCTGKSCYYHNYSYLYSKLG